MIRSNKREVHYVMSLTYMETSQISLTFFKFHPTVVGLREISL